MNDNTLVEELEMKKNREKIVLMLALAAVLVVSIMGYVAYVQHQFYAESTESLLETYEQVDKTFTMFAQRNWNVLSEWGKNLADDTSGEEVTADLSRFNRQKNTWQYSGLYLFNEDCIYLDAEGGYGVAKHIWGAFAEMYTSGEPNVGSYTMKNGERRVVFTVPIAPVTVEGDTYTCLAVSYDNGTLEEMIGGHAYGGQSDCYILYPNGNVMLSEEPKSEIEARMTNLFDYLKGNAQISEKTLAALRADVAAGGSGSAAYLYGGKSYYLVYQPVGFQNLTIVGIVDRSVVDAGMRKIQTVTILLLLLMMGSAVFTLVRMVKLDARQAVEEKEYALHVEAAARRKLENLANTDGLTGLYNERCFNNMLKEKEEMGQSFALFYLDLDKFKPVNDTYGHDVGDQLLRAVADRLRGCVRSSDAVFRIGGDEFALIVNGVLDAAWCSQRMEKIKSIIRQPYTLDGKTIEVGTSCGFACYPADGGDVRVTRILADQRMYEDKQKSGSSRGKALPEEMR